MKDLTLRVVLPVLACVCAIPAWGAGQCTISTLNGTYIYRVTGTMFKGGNGLHVTAPGGEFAAIGLLRLTNGIGTGVESSSNVGVLSQRSVAISYTIHGDCTATTDLTYCPDDCSSAVPLALNNLVMASDGSYAWFVNTVPKTSLTGELRRVPGNACSPLAGSYNLTASGAGLNGGGNAQVTASSTQFAAVGVWTFGASNAGQDIAAFGGLIIPRQYPMPQSLNSDCTGDMGGGAINPVKVYAASDGSEVVWLNWFPGTIVSGWLRRQ